MTNATNKTSTKTAGNKGENKEVIAAVVVAAAPAVIAKPATKADAARVILGESYADMGKVPARKDIIGRLVHEAKLTPAGAATYLQNYKRKQGLTQAALAEKATAATA